MNRICYGDIVTHQDNVDSHSAFNWFTAGKVGEHAFRKLGGLVRNRVNTERSLKSKANIYVQPLVKNILVESTAGE